MSSDIFKSPRIQMIYNDLGPENIATVVIVTSLPGLCCFNYLFHRFFVRYFE